MLYTVCLVENVCIVDTKAGEDTELQRFAAFADIWQYRMG